MFPWFFSIHAIHKSRSATSPFDCQRGRGKSLNLWKIGAVQIILNNLKAYQTISNHLKFSKTILKHLKCKSSTIIWGVLPTIHPLNYTTFFPRHPRHRPPDISAPLGPWIEPDLGEQSYLSMAILCKKYVANSSSFNIYSRTK